MITKNSFNRIGKTLLIGATLFVLTGLQAKAATLYLKPSSESLAVGSIERVSVYVDSENEAMNGVSGILSFSPALLEVTSISKDSSIVSIWAEEPKFSNTEGTVQFEGIVLNPGFEGTAGKVLTINFKTKSKGTAEVTLREGTVLANDGAGTGILERLGGPLKIQIQEGDTKSVTQLEIAPAPTITSKTHPDPEKWYRDHNPKFEWKLGGGVAAVRLRYDREPLSQPSILYAPVISEKQLENIGDGIWYFHVQLKKDGEWGKITHFRFQVDATPPEPFTLSFLDGKESDNPRPIVNLSTTDNLSGVDYYEVQIGAEKTIKINGSEITSEKPYALPLLDPGKHSVIVRAFDRAGNVRESNEEITVLPIQKPVIIEYPSTVKASQTFVVKGTSLPNTRVELFVASKEGTRVSSEVITTDLGIFTVNWSTKLKPGTYDMSAVAIDARGAKSLESEKVTMIVEKTFISSLYFLILLGTLFLVIGTYFVTRKRLKSMRNVRTGISSMDTRVHIVFDTVREEISEHVTKLLQEIKDSKTPGREGQKTIAQIKRSLDNAEREIRKSNENLSRKIK